jgi:hypothetical protein
MAQFLKKSGVIVLAILSIFLLWDRSIEAASPIWAPPDLSDLIEEGLTQRRSSICRCSG